MIDDIDWVTKIKEIGIGYCDDNDEAKRFGKHFIIRFDDDVPALVAMFNDMAPMQAYADGWNNGYQEGYLEAIKRLRAKIQ